MTRNKPITNCPYCKGTNIVKRGKRVKKHEKVQLYFCKKCRKKFTPGFAKYKTFPLRVILSSITRYNRLSSLEESARQVSEKYAIRVSPQNISNWLDDFGKYVPFLRLRQFIAKKYTPRNAFATSRLFHGQIYDFGYHRAKTDLILDEQFKHTKFAPLQEFLELVFAECPHQIFRQTNARASEYRDIFNLDQVRISRKTNTALSYVRLVNQAVSNRKLRHQAVQNYMLYNDSVTVAVEVPVLLAEEDVRHYRDQLGFDIPAESLLRGGRLNPDFSGESHDFSGGGMEQEQVITGHIDLIQIRNGAIHILDYKPSARKEKPVDQLTIYALALSRLTTLRLFHFKCAWFDDEDYFEFFPLHVVYKKKKKKKKKR